MNKYGGYVPKPGLSRPPLPTQGSAAYKGKNMTYTKTDILDDIDGFIEGLVEALPKEKTDETKLAVATGIATMYLFRLGVEATL